MGDNWRNSIYGAVKNTSWRLNYDFIQHWHVDHNNATISSNKPFGALLDAFLTSSRFQ